MKTISEIIETHKTESGKSDTDIAESCGLAKQTIHRLRHGGKANALTLGALSRYLGIPYRVLAESNERLQPQQDSDI